MSTVAEFALPPTEFVLAWAVKSVPDVRVEVERVVVDGTEEVTPYFWVIGEDLDDFEGAMDDDMTVDGVVMLEDRDGERFYRANWRDRVRGILYALADEVASVMTATYDDGTWSLRTLFADHETLSRFHHYCATYDVPLELERLYDQSNPRTYAKYELTPEQEVALTEALRMGYFEVPRRAPLEEVAEQLGVSQQAASARIRRGSANLVRNTLTM